MRNLTPIALALLVASCASTTPKTTSTPSGQIVELDPFKSQLVGSARAKDFRIYDMVIEDVPTRVELYGPGDPAHSGHRVLETQPALVVTVHFDDGLEREIGEDDALCGEVDLVLPADTLSPELTAQIRELSDETWWRPIDNRRKLNKRRELARNHLTLEVREYSKDVRVIDANRSIVCPKDHIIEPLSASDDLALLRQTVKEVTLVTEPRLNGPPMNGLTAGSHDD